MTDASRSGTLTGMNFTPTCPDHQERELRRIEFLRRRNLATYDDERRAREIERAQANREFAEEERRRDAIQKMAVR